MSYDSARRLRVVPLAIGAVVATCASMAVAAALLHDVTERPGVEIISDELTDIGRAAAAAIG